jgi:hypothetical protein
MPETRAILEGHLDWVKQHYAAQLTGDTAPTLGDRALRDGLMLLVDMRFTRPPRRLYKQIAAAPTADLVRWAAMTFQVGGLVAVCKEILADD